MWNPPRPGIKPLSSELAGGFLTTGPPGKSWVSFLMALIPARGLHPHDLITSQRTHLLIPGVCCCCLPAKSCPTLFGPPQTIACQAPLSMKFTRQEYETRVGCHFLFRGPSWPRDRTWVSYTGRWTLYHWAQKEALIVGIRFQHMNFGRDTAISLWHSNSGPPN